jgi:hypothetical protein
VDPRAVLDAAVKRNMYLFYIFSDWAYFFDESEKNENLKINCFNESAY